MEPSHHKNASEIFNSEAKTYISLSNSHHDVSVVANRRIGERLCHEVCMVLRCLHMGNDKLHGNTSCLKKWGRTSM